MKVKRNDAATRANLAVNLGAILTEKGWSRRRLAQETGDPPSSIYRALKGESMTGAGVLRRIAHALGVTVDSLLGPIDKNSQKTR